MACYSSQIALDLIAIFSLVGVMIIIYHNRATDRLFSHQMGISVVGQHQIPGNGSGHICHPADNLHRRSHPTCPASASRNSSPSRHLDSARRQERRRLPSRGNSISKLGVESCPRYQRCVGKDQIPQLRLRHHLHALRPHHRGNRNRSHPHCRRTPGGTSAFDP